MPLPFPVDVLSEAVCFVIGSPAFPASTYAVIFAHVDIIACQIVTTGTLRSHLFNLAQTSFILRTAFRTKAFSNLIEILPYRAQAHFIVSVLLFDALAKVAVSNSYVLKESDARLTDLAGISQELFDPGRRDANHLGDVFVSDSPRPDAAGFFFDHGAKRASGGGR